VHNKKSPDGIFKLQFPNQYSVQSSPPAEALQTASKQNKKKKKTTALQFLTILEYLPDISSFTGLVPGVNDSNSGKSMQNY